MDVAAAKAAGMAASFIDRLVLNRTASTLSGRAWKRSPI